MTERQQQLLNDCGDTMMIKQAVIILGLSGQTIEGLPIDDNNEISKADVITRLNTTV